MRNITVAFVVLVSAIGIGKGIYYYQSQDLSKKQTLKVIKERDERQNKIVRLYQKRAGLLLLGYSKGYFKNSDAKALLSRAIYWNQDWKSRGQVEEIQSYIDQHLAQEIIHGHFDKVYKKDLESLEREINQLKTSLKRLTFQNRIKTKV